jgi:hypothetical protein
MEENRNLILQDCLKSFPNISNDLKKMAKKLVENTYPYGRYVIESQEDLVRTIKYIASLEKNVNYYA